MLTGGMRQVFEHSYRVVRWTDRDHMIEEVAQCSNWTLADAVWMAAMKMWPTDEITLQHGIRVMKSGRDGIKL